MTSMMKIRSTHRKFCVGLLVQNNLFSFLSYDVQMYYIRMPPEYLTWFTLALNQCWGIFQTCSYLKMIYPYFKTTGYWINISFTFALRNLKVILELFHLWFDVLSHNKCCIFRGCSVSNHVTVFINKKKFNHKLFKNNSNRPYVHQIP